jgi:hypothetical protein
MLPTNFGLFGLENNGKYNWGKATQNGPKGKFRQEEENEIELLKK